MAGRVIGTATVNVKANTSEFNSALDTMTTGLRGKVSTIAGLIGGLGLGRLASEAVSFGARTTVSIDNARAMFGGLTDSAGEADELLRRMTTYAINTPFELPSLAKTAAQLIAVGDGFGVTTDNVEGYLDTLGNVVAASGGTDETMERLVRVLGQMSSSGKVLGQDMNQLAQNIPGLDVWQVLADGTGKSVEALRELQDQGKLDELLTGNEAVGLLLEGMKGFPGASGAMERKMGTLEGSMSKFKEQMGLTLYEGLKPFFNTLQDGMSNPAIMAGITGLVTQFSALATQVITGLMPHMPALVEGFGGLVEALIPLAPVAGDLAGIFAIWITAMAPVITLIAEVVGWITNFIAAADPAILTAIGVALAALWLIGFGPIGWVVAAIILVTGIITALLHMLGVDFDDVMKKIHASWQWLYDNVFQPIGDFVQGIIDFFQNLYDTLVGHSIIPDMVNAIISWFNVLATGVKAIVQAIATVVKFVWEGIKSTIDFIVQAIVFIVQTHVNLIRTAVETVFNGIKAFVGLVWEGIKTAIIEPIQQATELAGTAIQKIKDKVNDAWGGLAGVVAGIWNGVKAAITTPIQAAYDFVADKVNAIKNLVQGAIDKVNSIPGAGAVGGLIGKIPGLASGGIVNHPTLAVLGERSRREAVIPLTNPGRAMQLMQQSGLDRLAGQMNSSRGFSGPLISMPGAVIQDATDADLVAQRTLIALQAAMAA